MIKYNIHEIVEIILDDRVGEPLISAIDFQIGYFRDEVINDSNIKNKIIIKPYGDYVASKKENCSVFHLSKGLQSRLYHNEEQGLVVVKKENGFDIYSSSPNFLINIYIQLLLISHGITMVHAAAVANNDGNVILFPGAGGVGKTALLGGLVEEYGYKQLGDDLILLNTKGKAMCFPRSFVLKEYHRSVYPEVFERLNIKRGTNYGLKRFIVENAPFVGIAKKLLKKWKLYYKVAHSINLTSYLATVPVEEILGAGTVLECGQVSKIIFLERYEGSEFKLEILSEESLLRRMFAIIFHEWVDNMREFFSISAMELVDLPSYCDSLSEIIKASIKGIECKILFIPNGAKPKEVLNAYIGLC